jgi:tetratricopeptide (TPR) repeat protein
MALFGKTLSAAGTLVVTAAALGAQAPAKPTCDIGDALKGNTARASLSFDMARQSPAGPLAVAKLKDAVKTLESADKGEDPVARSYVMGEALSLWLNQPGIGMTPKRSDVGLTTNPDATIDLIGAVDSLFRVVEAAKPNCTDFTSYYRGGQKFYLDLANNAINSLNADKLDSAEIYATLANRLYPGSPYGVMVQGSVAAKRNNNEQAVKYWSQAATVAERDSTYRDVRRQMLANVGSVYLNSANSAATPAEKAVAARKAADAYRDLLAVPGTKGSYTYGGRQSYQSALLMAGDTAAFVKSYELLIANPSAYEYQDLLNSAVNAARANRNADAAKLFEATLAQNPYNRDALFNQGVVLLALGQHDKVSPVVTRLVAVDPGNPENYNLGARAYLELAKAAQAAKKTAVASAYNDSTLTWYNRGNKLPVEITFTEFSPSEKQLVVSGTVLDRRDKVDVPETAARPTRGKAPAKPAVASKLPPKAVTLKFEALDKSGAVVGTQTVVTDPLSPGKTARFSVTVPGTNAMAYRYTIVD